ncbi:carboxylesterase family [Fusarium albosuccineum]|uniref:Carboxylesterase family n=1 Tax=Fusarium albosuccineum TaxID=1237068 RepID=A0A8H4PDL1_9HYPO|nr:carboxylesterase family [Fusarium albosuccineum]
MNLKSTILKSLKLSSGAQGSTGPPVLQLPWGTYQAQVNAFDDQIYVFQDVRFGAPPLRFNASEFPQETNSSIQVSPPVTDCVQFPATLLKNGPGGRSRLGDPQLDLAPGVNWSGTEDCLFLDIYVPVSVFSEPDPDPLPVNVWFYGGAYAFGSKHAQMNVGGVDVDLPLYSGRSLLKASGYKSIFVAGNYRLGAFGWLAGSIMQNQGQPNAGLHDQHLLLKFVQKFIGQVHGDNTTVSAWGESAGGGSILHHLIRDDGQKDPLFHRFVTQSPAFEWAWNNSAGGELDKAYETFSDALGCTAPYNIECLRDTTKLSTEDLALQNIQLYANYHTTGLFSLGPAVDNDWVKTIPTLAFSQGKYWKNIKSSIVSHCANDAERFTPKDVTDQKSFNHFLNMFLPGDNLRSVRGQIADQYNCNGTFKGNYSLCLRHVIRDSSFTCNTRDLIDSYTEQTYAMNYGYPNDDLAYHASDLIPLFKNSNIQTGKMLHVLGMTHKEAAEWKRAINTKVQPRYLTYFASFALEGNTNSLGSTDWPVVGRGEPKFSNVMKMNATKPDPFLTDVNWMLVDDDQNSEERCSFWTGIAQSVMDLMDPNAEKEADVDVSEDVEEEL